MRKITLVLLLTISTFIANAQVEGLSYTLGADGQYSFWDDNSGLGDGILLGGQFGFGFGRYLELRASYYQGMDLTSDFSNHEDFDFTGLAEKDINLRRYGGDVRVNLLKTAFKPYIEFGAGVQELELASEELEEESTLYLRYGLGFMLTAGDRFSWSIYGNNTLLQSNPYATLLTAQERADYNLPQGIDAENMSNWTVGTQVSFYLGGRNPDKYSDLDRALERSFSTGFRGTTFELEPTWTWIDFNENLGFRNTQMVGGRIGANFGPYFGIRAFYFQALDNGKIIEFDPLAMYGGEAVFNLNKPNGIVPFIVLGGGYLDAGDNYEGRADINATTDDRPFAMGGLGLEVPFAKELLVKGSVRSMIMSTDDVEDVATTNQIQNSWMYQLGLEFKIGKKEDKPDIVEMSTYERELMRLQSERASAVSKYESEIERLERKMEEEKDRAKERELEEMKEELEDLKEELEESDRRSYSDEYPRREGERNRRRNARGADEVEKLSERDDVFVLPKLEDGEIYIRMGDAENTVGKGNEPKSDQPQHMRPNPNPQYYPYPPQPYYPYPQNPQMMPQQKPRNEGSGIYMEPDELEELLEKVAKGGSENPNSDAKMDAETAAKLARLEVQNEYLQQSMNQLQNQLSNTTTTRIVDTVTIYKNTTANQGVNHKAIHQMAGPNKDRDQFLSYEQSSAFAFIGAGEAGGMGIGYQAHFNTRKDWFDVVPQFYYGLVGDKQYGFDVNIQKDLFQKKPWNFVPFVGLGVGYAGLEETNDVVENTGTFNLLLGTHYYTPKAHFYFGYTIRNFFNQNQISAGYMFKF